MCGIAGVYHYKEPHRPVDRACLEGMTETLRHRGPDGSGHFFDPEVGVGLGHRRLSIVDLTSTGAQPMGSANGQTWLCYNGELYNHPDLRRELAARNDSFVGRSDTETLLKCLDAWGPAMLPRLLGIFAFAYWDRRTRRLLLVRDALGVKQLYYYDDGRTLYFASEIKALARNIAGRSEIDAEAANEYLHFHTPLFERTFFRSIRQVEPGQYLEISAAGARAVQYWSLEKIEQRATSPTELREEVDHCLQEVVRSQLMSDVPVATFFSGGIDSTLIASLAIGAQGKLAGFGSHFTGQGVIDEEPFQQLAARALGVDLHLSTTTGENFPEDFSRLMYFQDEPVIGPAMFPMYDVCKLASQSVKVCLGGQAADELFGGYSRHALLSPRLLWSGGFRGGGEGAAAPVGGSLTRQLFEKRTFRRLLRLASLIGDPARQYFETFAGVPSAAWESLLGERPLFDRPRAWAMFTDGVNDSSATNLFDRVLHWELRTYLPGLFHQDDRMSMACGLESRVPYADLRVVRMAFGIHRSQKVRAGTSKWILRQVLSGRVPPEVINRRKVGFDTPVGQWMKMRHRNFVRDTLLAQRATDRGFWNRKALEHLLSNHDQPYWTERVWKMLCIEMWARIFLDGEFPVAEAKPEAAVAASRRSA